MLILRRCNLLKLVMRMRATGKLMLSVERDEHSCLFVSRDTFETIALDLELFAYFDPDYALLPRYCI